MGCCLLPKLKTGRKTIVLNAPAMAVLAGLEKVGPYVVPGEDFDGPQYGTAETALGNHLEARWVPRRCALMSFSIRTHHSAPGQAWDSLSSASCWGIPRLPHSGMPILTPTTSAKGAIGRAVTRRRWRVKPERQRSAPIATPCGAVRKSPHAGLRS